VLSLFLVLSASVVVGVALAVVMLAISAEMFDGKTEVPW
jgi:hypothetical protein